MEIKELQKIMQDSGVAGAGGAGFPTYAKLTDKADTILMNCAECEPLLKLHRQLLEKHAYEIMKTFNLVAETVGASEWNQRWTFCVEKHKTIYHVLAKEKSL